MHKGFGTLSSKPTSQMAAVSSMMSWELRPRPSRLAGCVPTWSGTSCCFTTKPCFWRMLSRRVAPCTSWSRSAALTASAISLLTAGSMALFPIVPLYRSAKNLAVEQRDEGSSLLERACHALLKICVHSLTWDETVFPPVTPLAYTWN